MPMPAAQECLRVRAYLPHYCAAEDNPSYGSGRGDQRRLRELAFWRCLAALQGQRRRRRDLVLHVGERLIDATPCALEPEALWPALRLEIRVVTNGRDRLAGVLDALAGDLQELVVEPDDPRQLPLLTRDRLIADPEPADLWLYLEDDLLLLDPLFFDKQWWWLALVDHQQVLMPHRYELVHGGAGGRLLVDGALAAPVIEPLNHPQPAVVRGTFAGREVIFDRTTNPHSGLFVISERQRQQLGEAPLPRDGFVGPLETAATHTVLHRYPVCKPSLAHRRFLMVEHGHPSFLPLVDQLPLRPLGAGEPLGELQW
jgi:hypothetical protein